MPGGTPSARVRLGRRLGFGVSLYRNAYALVLNTGLNSLLGISYWVIAARKYSASAVGVASALIATMMLISNLSQLNLTGALLRFIPSAGQRTARRVVGSA